MNYFSEHKKGFIGSGIVHLIILLLLLWGGLITAFPPPAEEGILVNFGNSENGLGLEEPGPAPNNSPVLVEEKKAEVVVAPFIKTAPPKIKPQAKAPEKEEVMTQDYEKTVAIAAEKKRKEENDRVKREEALKERQRIAEIEKQKQEEIERQQLAELERQKQAEETRKISEINSRTKGAFEKSGNGVGGTGSGNSQSQSQGVTFPGGNQGVLTGSPDAPNYGPGGSGSGNKGTGPSYSLSGRNATSLPKPNYPGNEDGVVVVQVTVDKNGNVTKAEPGVRGSTTARPDLLAAAQKAALEAKFNLDKNAPAFQTGTITYKFLLE